MTFLSKVEDTFHISGRGCVIVPVVPRSTLDFHLRVQDSIQLRNPYGKVLDTYIAGIERVCGPTVKGRMAFLLPADVTESEVPKGTEIWLAHDPSPR
jgi:translation elongation factor EF-Tu-like GTPase